MLKLNQLRKLRRSEKEKREKFACTEILGGEKTEDVETGLLPCEIFETKGTLEPDAPPLVILLAGGTVDGIWFGSDLELYKVSG